MKKRTRKIRVSFFCFFTLFYRGVFTEVGEAAGDAFKAVGLAFVLDADETVVAGFFQDADATRDRDDTVTDCRTADEAAAAGLK